MTIITSLGFMNWNSWLMLLFFHTQMYSSKVAHANNPFISGTWPGPYYDKANRLLRRANCNACLNNATFFAIPSKAVKQLQSTRKITLLAIYKTFTYCVKNVQTSHSNKLKSVYRKHVFDWPTKICVKTYSHKWKTCYVFVNRIKGFGLLSPSAY